MREKWVSVAGVTAVVGGVVGLIVAPLHALATLQPVSLRDCCRDGRPDMQRCGLCSSGVARMWSTGWNLNILSRGVGDTSRPLLARFEATRQPRRKEGSRVRPLTRKATTPPFRQPIRKTDHRARTRRVRRPARVPRTWRCVPGLVLPGQDQEHAMADSWLARYSSAMRCLRSPGLADRLRALRHIARLRAMNLSVRPLEKVEQ